MPPADGGGTSRLLVLDSGRADLRFTHAHAPRAAARAAAVATCSSSTTRGCFPARLLGHLSSGRRRGRVPACVADRRVITGRRWCTPGQRLEARAPAGVRARRASGCTARWLEQRFFGRRLVRLRSYESGAVEHLIDAIGHVPLPPYIRRPDLDADRERYQTVFARERSGRWPLPPPASISPSAMLREIAGAGVKSFASPCTSGPAPSSRCAWPTSRRTRSIPSDGRSTKARPRASARR